MRQHGSVLLLAMWFLLLLSGIAIGIAALVKDAEKTVQGLVG